MNDDSSLVEKPPEPGSHDKARRLMGALIANLVPVAGVLFWGWNAGLLMLVYWLENVVIGVFNVLRMGAAGAAQGVAGLLTCLFVIPFFCVHYGMFCAVHGVFVWAMFGKGLENVAGITDPFSPDFLPALFADQPGLWAALATIVLWQGAMFALFLIRGEYRNTDPMTEMSAPYGRIVVLHLVIIGGGFIVLSLGQPWLGVLMLALGKTALELGGFAFGQQQQKTRAAWAQSRAQLEALMKRRAAPDAPPPQ